MYAALDAASLSAYVRDGKDTSEKQSNLAEQDLVQQLQAGNELAFRQFVERYRSKICRVAYGILGSREDAEDVAQQVFVKVYFSIKRFEGRSSLCTWLNRIAINECYGLLRKKRRTPYEGHSGDTSVPDRVQTTLDPCPRPDRAALQRNFLNKLLESIPEGERRLLLLRELEGYSVAQLAEEAGVKENTIKVRLFRARQRLVANARRHPFAP